MRRAAEEERGEGALRPEADEVRNHHQPLARESVGECAADEEEDAERDRARGEHEPEVGRRTGEVEDGERDGDRRDVVADDRARFGEEASTKRALAERGERSGEPSPDHVVCTGVPAWSPASHTKRASLRKTSCSSTIDDFISAAEAASTSTSHSRSSYPASQLTGSPGRLFGATPQTPGIRRKRATLGSSTTSVASAGATGWNVAPNPWNAGAGDGGSPSASRRASAIGSKSPTRRACLATSPP